MTDLSTTDLEERDELICPNDFRSIELALYFKNLVAGNESWDPAAIELDELDRDGRAVVVRLPANSCMIEHHVLLKVARRDIGGRPVIFETTGKVLGVQATDDEQLRVRIGLVQYDTESWTRLCGLFGARQAEITEFLKQARE